MRTLTMIVLLALASRVPALNQGAVAQNSANPIRKVVTLLQNMQKKIVAEGEKESELFEKYMCYCKTSGGDLGSSISAAETKIPQLGSDIKESEAKKAQLDEDIKQHQTDRSAAKAAMASATALREKEAVAYAKASSEDSANIAAVEHATAAIEKGMSGAFIQSGMAGVLRRLAEKRQEDELVSFLSGSQEYAPASGQITGILKTMHDEMTKDFNEEKAAELAAIQAYDQLMAAKTKEVNALTKAIEEKMTRTGELGVEIAQMKNDLGDTEQALMEDKQFLADLEKTCATKQAEWEVIVKTRNEELLALADTIKILNDDDSLELFKTHRSYGVLVAVGDLRGTKSGSGEERWLAGAETKWKVVLKRRKKRSFGRAFSSDEAGDGPDFDFVGIVLMADRISEPDSDGIVLMEERTSDTDSVAEQEVKCLAMSDGSSGSARSLEELYDEQETWLDPVSKANRRRCDNCQGYGHLDSQCTAAKACYVCGSCQHFKRDCPLRDSICSFCLKPGHTVVTCRLSRKERNNIMLPRTPLRRYTPWQVDKKYRENQRKVVKKDGKDGKCDHQWETCRVPEEWTCDECHTIQSPAGSLMVWCTRCAAFKCARCVEKIVNRHEAAMKELEAAPWKQKEKK